MKVVILCGGQGTRLREETQLRPKPMVEVGGKPILWHIMKIYSHYGFREFVLCLGYKGEVIKEYFLNYEAMNNDFTVSLGPDRSVQYHRPQGSERWRVTVVDTGVEATKGARILGVRHYLDGDRFLLTYGDGVSDVDLGALVDSHTKSGKLVTFTGVRPVSRFGVVDFDGQDEVITWKEKTALEGFINGGFFVMEPAIMKYLDPLVELEGEPMETLVQERKVNMYRHTGFWACMDTYRDFLHLNDLWNRGRAPWKVWRE